MIKVTDIVWDTDGEAVDSLPDTITIDANIPKDSVADYLSDTYGWCVESYSVRQY